MHAHESPFYHCAQFPHLSTITYLGKKYSQIFFGQTMYYSTLSNYMLHRLLKEAMENWLPPENFSMECTLKSAIESDYQCTSTKQNQQ
jgi:hypothetical protein